MLILLNPIKMANTHEYIVVHHSVTPRDLSPDITENSFNNSHKAREFPKSKSGWYIGYHYVVFGTGEVRQYRQDTEVGAHCKEGMMNFKGIGICMVGDFDKETPSMAQVKATFELIKRLRSAYNIPSDNVKMHRDYALNSSGKPYKSCPGNNIKPTVLEYLTQFMGIYPQRVEWQQEAITYWKNKGVLKDDSNLSDDKIWTLEILRKIDINK